MNPHFPLTSKRLGFKFYTEKKDVKKLIKHNQSINQSIDRSINQSVNQSINLSLTSQQTRKNAVKSPHTIQTIAKHNNPSRGFRHEEIIEEIILILQRARQTPLHQRSRRPLRLTQIHQLRIRLQPQDWKQSTNPARLLCLFRLLFHPGLFSSRGGSTVHAKGGGEDKCLPFGNGPRIRTENLHDTGQFAKMTSLHHAIGFVDDQVANRGETGQVWGLILNVLIQASGSGDDNIRLPFQKAILFLLKLHRKNNKILDYDTVLEMVKFHQRPKELCNESISRSTVPTTTITKGRSINQSNNQSTDSTLNWVNDLFKRKYYLEHSSDDQTRANIRIFSYRGDVIFDLYRELSRRSDNQCP